MVVLNVLGLLIWSAMAGWWSYGAVRTWSGPANALSTRGMFRGRSARSRENVDRCAPTVAALLVCVAAVFAGGAFVPSRGGGPLVAEIALSAGFFGAFLSAFLLGLVFGFNLPKSLVPPHLRAARGTSPNLRRGRGKA